MRFGILWAFMPDQALPLVIVLVAGAVLLGMLRARIAAGVIACVLLLPVVGALLEGVVATLPLWVTLVLLLMIGLSLLRGALALLLGGRAADEAMGTLAAHAILAGVRALFFPLRLALRALINGRMLR